MTTTPASTSRTTSRTTARTARPARRPALAGAALVAAGLLVGCSAGGSDAGATKASAKAPTAEPASTTVTDQADQVEDATDADEVAVGTPVGDDAEAPEAPTTPAPAPDAPAPAPPAPAPAPQPSGPKPVITSFTTPEDIDCHNGDFQEFSASWTTTGATETMISIDGPGGYKTYGPNDSDSLPFSCSTPHTFLLTATGPDGRTATRSITLQPRNAQLAESEGDALGEEW